MDDSNKKPVGGVANQQAVGDDQATQVQQTPVGSGRKEQGSTSGMKMEEADRIAKEEGDEYWENYSREIELEKQVLEMGGVEKINQGEVPMPEQVAKEMGIRSAVNAQSQVGNPQAGFSVSGVSLSDDQVTQGIQKPTSTGFRWLSEWFIYQLLKAHFHIKRVKNKISRSKD